MAKELDDTEPRIDSAAEIRSLYALKELDLYDSSSALTLPHEKIKDTEIGSLGNLDALLDLTLLSPRHDNGLENLNRFLKSLDFTREIVGPILVAKIALLARKRNNSEIIKRIDQSNRLGRKEAGGVVSVISHLTTLLCTRKEQKLERTKILDAFEATMMNLLDSHGANDALLYLIGLCIHNSILELSALENLGLKIIESIDRQCTSRLLRIIEQGMTVFSDPVLSNLLLAHIFVDKGVLTIGSVWKSGSSEEEVSTFTKLWKQHNRIFLSNSNHLKLAIPVLSSIGNHPDLRKSYWAGASLILLEVIVMKRIHQLKPEKYNEIINHFWKYNFEDRVQILEDLQGPSVNGISSDKFHEVRNKVVHGERGLTHFDEKVIAEFTAIFLGEVLDE